MVGFAFVFNQRRGLEEVIVETEEAAKVSAKTIVMGIVVYKILAVQQCTLFHPLAKTQDLEQGALSGALLANEKMERGQNYLSCVSERTDILYVKAYHSVEM